MCHCGAKCSCKHIPRTSLENDRQHHEHEASSTVQPWLPSCRWSLCRSTAASGHAWPAPWRRPASKCCWFDGTWPPGPGRHLTSLGWTSRAAGVVVASATATAATSSRQPKEEDRRASRNVSGFQPSIWGDFFLTYSSPLATSSAQKVCNNLN